MARTYRAMLINGRIEWVDPPPRAKEPTPVHITVVGGVSDTDTGRGKAMADALRRLADQGGIASISDPVEWQRQVREERRLPGRES